MTFGDLQIGSVIYRCNFNTGEIVRYEITNIEDSRYPEQLQLSLHNIDTKISYYGEYVNNIINVFRNKSNEPRRQIIGNDDDTMWCADKNAAKMAFNKYKDKILMKLNEQEKTIDRL